MASAENCAFCSPEQLQERVIRLGELVVSFLSKPAYRPGQTLVIPRRHVKSIEELTDPEIVAVMREVGRVGKILNLSYGWESHQKVAPQQVGNGIAMEHMHYHVVPKHESDEVFAVPESLEAFYIPTDKEIAYYVHKLQ